MSGFDYRADASDVAAGDVERQHPDQPLLTCAFLTLMSECYVHGYHAQEQDRPLGYVAILRSSWAQCHTKAVRNRASTTSAATAATVEPY